LYACQNGKKQIVAYSADGREEVLAEQADSNDLAVTHAGNVYFTDPAFGTQSDHRELDFYGVYHIPLKGAPMKVVAKPAGRPNGIALAPTGKVLYVVNSDERNVRATTAMHASWGALPADAGIRWTTRKP